MNYEAKISETIKLSSPEKIIIPISMGKGSLSGERLEALIKELKSYKHEITVIIADTLNRHNSKNELEDLKNGDNYLKENKYILSQVSVLRWDDFIKKQKKEFIEKLSIIEDKCKPNSEFNNKLVRTINKSQLGKKNKLEDSIAYLKEEYAVFLMFQDYKYLVYPKPIADGLAYVYKLFPEYLKPSYEQAKVESIGSNNVIEYNFFNNKAKRMKMSFAAKLVVDQVETFFKSSEISIHDKQTVLDMISNIGILTVEIDDKTVDETSFNNVN
ncbi:MAG: hypothetical protein LEGION0398_MBIBDBAK_01375 [Legionellaceae bacterium]